MEENTGNFVYNKADLLELRKEILFSVFEQATALKKVDSLKIPYKRFLNKKTGATKAVVDDICTSAANNDTCFTFVQLGTEHIWVKNINLAKLKACVVNHESEGLYKYGALVLDAFNAKISYKNKWADLSINNNPDRLLIHHFSKPGELLTFEEIDRLLDLNAYTDTDKTLVIHKIKLRMLKILQGVGVPKEMLTEMFINVRGRGYKFNPLPITS
ncbi:hypothetical protein A2716_03955 [candidate division WWE3 bacterium RIFCSPHIGHO2_01_FULL_40_23]|uniref:Uncharacterized protein n=1 Tax=candidate division WWE3 bacterium RIFCSPLOWO2_01_FULL_41_18 TaxID=1802625 RepID=A0A1F4VCQ6_UNCKA|nr:MAG: hypothetical protein A2716_03955 [candidate division WWE3 bacterium RIFCSPHIGHO2_01_FULL_40_23]OGC55032.1 MAG: hypothetical protein A3A78_03565 [candidate division WWE3 bacterium RIFCSPLOWO2_01_FULL_41_18]